MLHLKPMAGVVLALAMTGCGTLSASGSTPSAKTLTHALSTQVSHLASSARGTVDTAAGAAATASSALPPTSGPTPALTFLTEPEDGITPWLTLIRHARHRIAINEYLLTDYPLIHALRQAAQRGVTVQVIIDGKPYGDATAVSQTEASFRGSRVQLKLAPARFEGSYSFDHAKYLIADSTAIMGSPNGTASAFEGYNLEDAVETSNATLVRALQTVFAADWHGTTAGLSPRGPLVLSPGAEPQLLALLTPPGPVAVMAEELGSAQTLYAALMTHRANARILVPSHLSTEGRMYATELAAAGVQVRTLANPYVHAKLIVTGTRTFIGSQNFSVVSFNDNREVGIITQDARIHAQALAWFNAAWAHATPWGQTASTSTTSRSTAPTSASLPYLPDGDTMAQVQKLWGQPASISHDVYHGTPETVWHYAGGTVYFEHGMVSYVHRS